MSGQPEPTSRTSRTTTPPVHILVIDDNNHHNGQVVSTLISEGYVTRIAETSDQALSLLRDHRFDVVLLEALTPTFDGYTVLMVLKNDPRFSHLPVIMMSAESDMEMTIKCIELGAEDFLIEPLQGELLKARINASLERKAARERDYVRLEDATTLRTISQAMNATLDPNRVLKLAFTHALQRLKPALGVIGTLDNGVLTVVDSFGFGERFATTNRLSLSEMGWQSVLQAERPYISQYQAVVKDAGDLSPFATCFVVPIRHRHTLAAMILYHLQDSSTETVSFVEQLADDAAVALWNAKLYSEAIGCVEHHQLHLNTVSREIKLASTTIKEYTSLLKLNTREVTRHKKLEALDAIRHNAAHLFTLSTDLETKIKPQGDETSPTQLIDGEAANPATPDDQHGDLPICTV